MPGLRKTDDRTFVSAFQSVDRAIINPWFMATFLGALILIGVAALMHFGAERRRRRARSARRTSAPVAALSPAASPVGALRAIRQQKVR